MKRNNNIIWILLLINILISEFMFSQVSSYVFTEDIGIYQSINPPAGQGVSNLSTTSSSNNFRAEMTLPFNFCINGTNHNNLAIRQHQNGFLSFGPTAPSITSANRAYPLTNFNNIICAFGDDLCTTGNSTIGWRIIGSSPNRIVVFQWGQVELALNGGTTGASNNYWRRVNNGHSNDRLHFQIRLHETTNVIEFHYIIIPHPTQNGAGSVSNIQIGLRGSSASDFNVRTKSAGGIWNNNTTAATALPTTAGLNTIPFNNKRDDASNNRPTASTTSTNAVNGTGTCTIFRWTPPVSGTWNNPSSWTNCYNPLSVTLNKFIGTKEKRDNKLEWETDSETNNDYFIVETSSNGADWSELNRVNGMGTTTHPSNYELYHFNPEIIQYYRLKQVDYDGTKIIYDTIVIERKIESVYIIRKTNLLGQEIDDYYRGIVIIQYSDGSIIRFNQ